jgi:hypothetical protein
MADARSNLIADLYQRALAHPPSERGRFVCEACSDDDVLRQEVESLLEFDAASEGFLERPATTMLATWRQDNGLPRRRKSRHDDR